jgi:hypothetical protein
MSKRYHGGGGGGKKNLVVKIGITRGKHCFIKR